MPLPDPTTEIQLLGLASLRGANYWSRAPLIRVELAIGAYEHISSADVPGFTAALSEALPGLIEHRCSIGTRGGFLERLRLGTYAPHVLEHVALELQSMLGLDVGFGRARGAGRTAEYTVVFEHRRVEVGLRSAAHALDLVQRAFAAAPVHVEPALDELRALLELPDDPPLRGSVLCAITGGRGRGNVRDELLAQLQASPGVVVDVAPSYILNVGLPFDRAAVAVIVDAEPLDVPPIYREPEPARRLVGVVVDAVEPGGVVVVPAEDRALHELVLSHGRRIALFTNGERVPHQVAAAAAATAWLQGGTLMLERDGGEPSREPLRPGASLNAQLAAALVSAALAEDEALDPHG